MISSMKKALIELSSDVDDSYRACQNPENHDKFHVWIGSYDGCYICAKCLCEKLKEANEDE